MVHAIGVPFVVTPVAPTVEQYAPGVTVRASDDDAWVVLGAELALVVVPVPVVVAFLVVLALGAVLRVLCFVAAEVAAAAGRFVAAAA